MRKADAFLVFLGTSLLILGLMLVQAHRQTKDNLVRLRQVGEMVQYLRITDLCLSTDARYTRHSSQADWHSAFQSHPLALDHFPSGSLLKPPDRLRKSYAPVD